MSPNFKNSNDLDRNGWFLLHDENYEGPIPHEDVLGRLQAGSFPRHTLLWKSDMDSWKSADDLAESSWERTRLVMTSVDHSWRYSEEALDEILIKRAATHTKRYDYDVGVFKTLAKFPPAFGLLGTTLGMIALLQQLGGKDAQKLLGPAMAIGLVATFYGLTLANLVFIPISENLAVINREDETLRTIVIDGLRLVRKREHPKVVEEHLKSYLLPHERARLNRKKA